MTKALICEAAALFWLFCMKDTEKDRCFMKRKSLKIRQGVLAFILFFSLPVLSACKSNAEEMVFRGENHENIKSAGMEEAEGRIGTEEVKEKSGAEEIQQNMENSTNQVLLTEVTWEDMNDGVYEPFLHFSFSNGNIVDKELPYLSIVKGIEYKDITGDGEEEVVVYREFVNTAHDDYILMDFFKIEDDTITEISPSADIPELAEVAYDTEIVNGFSDEYTIVLKMESCGKTVGVLYTDTIMTVGYGREGWEVIQQQKIPDWKLVYLDYLAGNADVVIEDGRLFWLAYVDGDEIPELFFNTDDTQFAVSFLTCENGEVKEVGDFTGQKAALWYREKEGNLLYFNTVAENSALTAYYFQNGELEEITRAYANMPSAGDETLEGWYWEEEEVSREEYEERSDAETARMTHKIEYENGISFDELWSILGCP